MERYHVQDGGAGWHGSRQACDATGTSFAGLCGLDEGKSRARAWRMHRGIEKESTPPPDVRDMLDRGKEDEFWAAEAFRRVCHHEQFLLNHTGQWKRMAGGFVFGCNLDRLLYTMGDSALALPCAVEIKTIQNGSEGEIDEWPTRLMANTLQLLLQLWCARLPIGYLFYWRRSDGCYRLYTVQLNEGAFVTGPLQWAMDTLREPQEPKRMNSDLKQQRIAYVLKHFYVQ